MDNRVDTAGEDAFSPAEREIRPLACRLVEVCRARGVTVASAESCTGGIISAAITAVPGSSAIIELGVCSYSNRIKLEVLGVSDCTLARFSEYSVQCAEEMAEGARRLAHSDYAVSTTGVAGPSGGSEKHPVGEVCIAVCGERRCVSKRFMFEAAGSGSRRSIRASAAAAAVEMLLGEIEHSGDSIKKGLD